MLFLSGNANAAGAQIPGKRVEEVEKMLRGVLDQYFEGEDEEEARQAEE